jgi:hypothetical protein
MSKTSQRKCAYYQQGYQDAKDGYGFFLPMVLKSHVLNKRYLAGYKFYERNKELAEGFNLLQWFRVTFFMASA